jgi:hypothetical protein
MSKWELTVVENAGEIPASKVKDEIAIEVKPLLIYIKAQLMIAMPKTLAYTVGWRALVWQNKETGMFKDISEEELEEYRRTGTITNTSPNGTDAGQSGSSDGNETSNDGGTATDS